MDQIILASMDGDSFSVLFVMSALAFSVTLMGVLYRHKKYRLREQTRQELAAYVAEGSMTPEDAERIIKAGTEDD